MLERAWGLLALLSSVSACADLLGLDDYDNVNAGGSPAVGGASGTMVGTGGGAMTSGTGGGGSTPPPSAYYTFDVAAELPDEMGGHDGSIEGIPAIVMGKVGGGLAFDGTDDAVEFANWPSLPRVTISVWLKFPTLGGTTVDLPILERWAYNRDQRSIYLLRNATGVVAQVSVTGLGSGNPYVDLGAPRLDEWTHYVLRWDGNVLTVYLDGNEFPQTQGTGTGDLASHDLNPVYLARNRYGTAYIAAAYDELVVWDVALEPAAIQELYELGANNAPASMLWR